MKFLFLILILPLLSFSQPFIWEPGGIPVIQEGYSIPQPLLGGNYNSDPELTDLNGDGLLDAILGDNTGRLWYFINEGTQIEPFFYFITYYLDSIDVGYESNPALVDIDDDGDLDLFIARGSNHGVHYYRNDGDSNQPIFTFITDSIEGIDWCISIDFADMDNDGDYDFFSGSGAGYIKYSENIGTILNYEFILRENMVANVDVGDKAIVEIKDMDSDGDYDLLVGSNNGNIYYLRNDGTPTQYDFTVASTNFVPFQGNRSAPCLGDLDGDGDLDLLVGQAGIGYPSLSSDVVYYENVGDSTNPIFEQRILSYFMLDCGIESFPRMVDIDDDSLLELFVGSAYNTIKYFENVGIVSAPSFTFITENYQNIEYGPQMKLDFCDIDGDGDYDMITGNGFAGNGYLSYYLNTGTHTNAIFNNNPISIFTFTGGFYSSPTSCDIDADGDYDIISGYSANGFLAFFRNIGNANEPRFNLEDPNLLNIGIPVANPCFCDIDQDDDYDLFIGSSSSIYYYENVGTPQNFDYEFVTNNWEDISSHFTVLIPYFSDIDNDGDPDLFLGNFAGGLYFYRNLSDNPQLPEVYISVNGNSVIISWEAYPSAEAYKIYYSNDPYFEPTGTPQAIVQAPATSWTDSVGVLVGKRYYRVVVSY